MLTLWRREEFRPQALFDFKDHRRKVKVQLARPSK